MDANHSSAAVAVAAKPGFLSFELAHGELADFSRDEFPTRLSAWSGAALALGGGATHFGFVESGPARLRCAAGDFALASGLYFSLPDDGEITGGRGIVLSRLGYRGLFMIGGPIEEKGRLRYIDGCTDTLLIPPVIKGDPCLNLLRIPPGTEQTRHTHPSLRAGIIVSGRGRCETPIGTIELAPGLVFAIPAESEHSFHTDREALRVIAFHPDSDFGPTHEDHPMVNRTIVEGLPAHRRPEILTTAEAAR